MKIHFAAMAAAVAFACCLSTAQSASAAVRPLDRAFVIMMENQGFDNVVGHLDLNNNPDTPFITHLAERYGLATLEFGVTHPSLPNYTSLIAGDYFGIQDDNPSCFAKPTPAPPCDKIDTTNLVDELEGANISWLAFEQTMPRPGYLGVQWPKTGAALYAQKHNPFVYFKDIATNPARLAKIRPLTTITPLARALANPATSPRFVLIVPDQCHDMHGQTPCSDPDQLLLAGDAYVQSLVQTIMTSPAYTRNSAIFVTWDENDFSSFLGCCDSPAIGGGHIATIVITPHTTKPIQSATSYNEYSILSTIEQAFGVGLLGHTSDSLHVTPLSDLLP
jgi:phospholipase C